MLALVLSFSCFYSNDTAYSAKLLSNKPKGKESDHRTVLAPPLGLQESRDQAQGKWDGENGLGSSLCSAAYILETELCASRVCHLMSSKD